jgi:pyruvate,water dikinase
VGCGWIDQSALHCTGQTGNHSFAQKDETKLVEYKILEAMLPEKRILKGIAVGDKIASGRVVIMYSLDGRDGSHDGIDFQEGDVLVTEMTDPDWEPIMKKASAIVTNKGGRTCHAAIVARELGVPAIVGTGYGTELLKDGDLITVSCCEGDAGFIYKGEIPFTKTGDRSSGSCRRSPHRSC